MNKILYIVINKELKMSPGKAAAQAVHAAMMLEGKYSPAFSQRYRRTVIVLEAENTQQLKNLYYYLQDTGLHSDYYIDEGHNEVDAFSATALAVEPIDEDDVEKREIFAGLKLYNPDNGMRDVINAIDRATKETADSLKSSELEETKCYLRSLVTYNKVPRYVSKTLGWLEKQ